MGTGTGVNAALGGAGLRGGAPGGPRGCGVLAAVHRPPEGKLPCRLRSPFFFSEFSLFPRVPRLSAREPKGKEGATLKRGAVEAFGPPGTSSQNNKSNSFSPCVCKFGFSWNGLSFKGTGTSPTGWRQAVSRLVFKFQHPIPWGSPQNLTALYLFKKKERERRIDLPTPWTC